jgi:antitoxin (DNA-binding transcriptional repressor) of toxin-antitoxin stability system
MKIASVSQLKSRLSEFLRLVRGGDSIMVMDRGRPVALLGPWHDAAGADGVVVGPDARLAELRDAGLVRVGSGKIPADYWNRQLPQDPESSVLSALLEERQEGR